jgi:hypothetical protein
VGGGVVTFVGAAAGSRITYGRSKRHHQALAIQARTTADSGYTAVSEPLLRINMQVDGIAALLGPADTATLRSRADKVIRGAQALADSYAAFAYQASDKANPGSNTGRGQYMKMTAAYGQFSGQLSKQLQALNELASWCEQLAKSIEQLPATATAVKAVIDAAATIISQRETEGWVVLSYSSTLDEATDTFANAEESRAACEYITAAVEYTLARQMASATTSAVRELPKKQQALLRTIANAERQETALRRNLAHTRESIPILLAAYDPACTQGLEAELDAAALQLAQFTALIADLREDTDPKRDAWEAADVAASRITQLGEEIAAACASVQGAKAKLDGIMQSVRTKANKTDAEIHRLYARMSARDYDGDQDNARVVLQSIEVALTAFIRGMNQQRPNVYQFQTDVKVYDKLVDRVERASRSVHSSEEDDAENILRSVRQTLDSLSKDD